MKLIIIVIIAFGYVDFAENVDERIMGGTVAGDGQFPHQVSLQKNGKHFCGGAIVSKRSILSAAHCVYERDMTGVLIVLGTNTLNQGGSGYTVYSTSIHPSFNPENLLNDVAILSVYTIISFNDKVQTIKLADGPSDPGTAVTLTGWGFNSYPGNFSNSLMRLNLKTIDLQSCAQSIGSTGTISTAHVCTTTPVDQGACEGDSGELLINTARELIGVVSWFVPCGTGLPDVYSSVAFYSSWIVATMEN